VTTTSRRPRRKLKGTELHRRVLEEQTTSPKCHETHANTRENRCPQIQF
jgi:hypothetical protein